MAKGKTREVKEFGKKTGFFEGEVVAVNPTKERLSKLLGTELEGEEIEYATTETVDGTEVKRIQIVFWIRSTSDEKYIKPVHFFLKNVERTNTITEEEAKAGTKVPKKQYINNLGITSWTDDPKNLFDWFVTRPYRVAKVGEEELYTFVSAWLNKLDHKDADSALLADFNKLINGDVKEFANEIGGDFAGTVMPLVVIRSVEKEGEKKEYEQVYNRDMLPGFAAKQVRTVVDAGRKIDDEFVKKAKLTDRKKRSLLQRFVLGVTDTQFGIKNDHYTLGFLEEYDPAANPKASGKVLTTDDTDY